MKWKILSIILTLSMVLSMMPVAAWAEEMETEEAAQTVISLGDGEDTAFPDAMEDAASPDGGENAASPGGAEAPETVVEEVQAPVDALPAVEDVRAMDMDGQRAAYSQAQIATVADDDGETTAPVEGVSVAS